MERLRSDYEVLLELAVKEKENEMRNTIIENEELEDLAAQVMGGRLFAWQHCCKNAAGLFCPISEVSIYLMTLGDYLDAADSWNYDGISLPQIESASAPPCPRVMP